jgi:hypothetical protein|nr:MAG TPA: hypothetical protein [Caudoviricetes sp.]
MLVTILNKQTGYSTECSNDDVIKICKADVDNYEVKELVKEVKELVKEVKVRKPKRETK